MVRIRNKVAWAVLMAASLLALAALAGAAQGGPIDPQAPPGSTGKNVITSLPITISEPGSYVLNGNLTCTACTSGQHGITIDANNVAIDLQGFDLVGAPGAGDGIHSQELDEQFYPREHLSVLNGNLRDWPGTAVWGESGLTVNSVRISSSGSGIRAQRHASITDCEVRDTTTGPGIQSGFLGFIDNCHVYFAATYGILGSSMMTISNTKTYQSGSTEIFVGGWSTLENCVAEGGGPGNGIEAAGINIVIRGCIASGNGGHGILTDRNATVEDCVATNNYSAGTSDGIHVGDNSVIRGCTSRNNGGTQIVAGNGSTVTDCAVEGFSFPYNTGDGIRVGYDGVISDCTARSSGGVEIKAGDGSTLENCVAEGGGTWGVSPGNGIEVGHDSIIRGCTSRSNGSHEIVAGNQVLIEDCVADGYGTSGPTAGDGIRVGYKSTVKDCNVTNNAGSGIFAEGYANRLEDNEVYDNSGWGIYLYGGNNRGNGNISAGNSGGQCYATGTDDFVQVTHATFGSATHPWINLC